MQLSAEFVNNNNTYRVEPSNKQFSKIFEK